MLKKTESHCLTLSRFPGPKNVLSHFPSLKKGQAHVTEKTFSSSFMYMYILIIVSSLLITVMPKLSCAEIQKRYRARRDANPEQRANYLAKTKTKYHDDIETGKRKLIRQQSEREKKRTRRKWKVEQARSRDTKKGNKAPITPPPTPTPDVPIAGGSRYTGILLLSTQMGYCIKPSAIH